MRKRQILINAVMSVLRILVVSIVMVLLYKYLIGAIGAEKFGIWSLVMATTAVSQIAGFGLPVSVVKFVAKYIALKREDNVTEVIQTAFFSVGIFVGLILFIGYPIAKFWLKIVVAEAAYPDAIAILPYALITIWLFACSGVFQGGLDGFQRIDAKSTLLMVGSFLNLGLCFLLVPGHGLMGVVYAGAIKNLIILISSWVLLKRELSSLPIIPYRWNKGLFREMIGYGTSCQVINVMIMFCDPITKAFLSKFGGLSIVGYYEMASKLVIQVRSLLVSANQVLVPAIADLKEKMPEKIQSVYSTSYQLLFYLTVPLYAVLIISMPVISKLWIGHYETVFVVFGTLLALGWALNTLAAPAYFANMGIGDLRWNVISHIVTALLNVSLGFFLGTLYGGTGVAAAWMCALVIGSSMIYLSYHKYNKIPLNDLLPSSSRVLALVCLFFVVSGLFFSYKFRDTADLFSINLLMISLSLIIFVPFWMNPMRRRVIGWVTRDLLGKSQ
ncbi:MAG: oligosaccharide flippase family protein [Candidatus Omnitrophica bacterium]|nr:oligosaccharide flippase family protein [Candidatus Omnitrophota bacterium]